MVVPQCLNMEKSLAIMLIILGIFLSYLNSQQKLLPVVNAVIASPANATGVTQSTLGSWTIAIVAYLMILSILTPSEGTELTILIIVSALVIDNKTMGTNSLLRSL